MSRIFVRKRLSSLLVGVLAASAAGAMGAQAADAPAKTKATAVVADHSDKTTTPIKHVIVIIGENRTFDHVFGMWTPPQGQTVFNLLSQGVLNADGTPGPNVGRVQQWQATDTGAYASSPERTQAFEHLPAMNTEDAPTHPFVNAAAQAKAIEPALPDEYYAQATTGATGLPKNSIDTRFPTTLPNAPVDSHNSISYDSYAGSPVHRFFQMWQELDCNVKYATQQNPSGCRADLFPWVAITAGTGSDGKPAPVSPDEQTTHQGGNTMQVLDADKGDAPYLVQLANTYASSDNFHQAQMGGTGGNHIMLGYGEPLYYADAKGNPAVPPTNQIENPNAVEGSNNWYTQDGYAGGSYVNCSDDKQPGVKAVKDYLHSLPYKPFNGGNCKKGAYYLVNNYNPGYLGDGTPAPLGDKQFTIPPSRQPNLALLLEKHGVSWKYYGEGWAGGKENGEMGTYCNICNPFLYSTQVMTNPKLRAKNVDIQDFYKDVQDNALPAVSIVKSDAIIDGHPASSKLGLFEGFTKKIVDMVQANPQLWADTAIVVAFDEGGGYWDSGYVQPIDFFGDGTRIPLIVVSPYSQGGQVVHTYYDHVSIDKFIEKNWGIRETISRTSRDNLPNPVVAADNPYVPTNAPAIGDLMELFDFSKQPASSPAAPH